MIGRQVIKVNKPFTLEELEGFMQAYWDTKNYNFFLKGKPTSLSAEEYILLPSTEHYIVCVYPRRAGKLFSKENKVILITADTPAGIKEKMMSSIPSDNIFFGTWKISLVMSNEKERKGPAEENLQRYSKYLYSLLDKEGYITI